MKDIDFIDYNHSEFHDGHDICYSCKSRIEEGYIWLDPVRNSPGYRQPVCKDCFDDLVLENESDQIDTDLL